jgi:hypothetical protein
MLEVWPIGHFGNSVLFEEIPRELSDALTVLSDQHRIARTALTVLAANPNVVHGPKELLEGIRGVVGGNYATQASNLHQTITKASVLLDRQGMRLPIRKEPLEKQPLNGNNYFKRKGWVWDSSKD